MKIRYFSGFSLLRSANSEMNIPNVGSYDPITGQFIQKNPLANRLQGWLYRYEKKTWKQRWCYIPNGGNQFFCCKNDQVKAPRDVTNLVGASIALENKTAILKGRRIVFKVSNFRLSINK